jgi:hypothetical protein
MKYQIKVPIDQINWLLVKGYSLKYSKIDEDTIKISIPYHHDYVNIHTKDISENFINALKNNGWSDNAILSLKHHILFPENGIWNKHMKKIAIKSGKLRN